MTLEATLVRIAEALERLTAPPPVIGEIPDATKGTTVVEPAKKAARGRPAKITTEEKDASTPAVLEEKKPAAPVDDFLDAPPPKVEKPPTLEEVRSALQAYAGKKGGGPAGTTEARNLMTKASSNGATRLSIAKDVPGGDQGVLLATDYAAVIKAALA